MRHFLLFISLCSMLPVSGQMLYPEVMEKRECLVTPLCHRADLASQYPQRLIYKKLPYDFIDNIGTRYTIQYLWDNRDSIDPELRHSIRTLLWYIGNEYLKNDIDYLKRYAEFYIPRQERAIANIQSHITADSLQESSDTVTYLNTDLQVLLAHIRQDSNRTWLRDAARDSVLVELQSSVDAPLRFWINNGKSYYYRFWVGNMQADTIGTWIQVLPSGNRMKIYIDENTYQIPDIEQQSKYPQNQIHNSPNRAYFNMEKISVAPVKPRYWTYYSEVELTMSQGVLKNWSGGGENSLSLLSNLRYFINYNRNKTSWESWVHYRFGFMKNGKEDMRKNEERFEINTKLGQKAFKHWYYTAQFNMVTQLFNSYDYPEDADKVLIANFMSPGDFTLSLGMDYKPNDNLSVVISPIAGKWTFVRDTARVDVSRYGISEESKRSKREAGAQVYVNSKLPELFKILELNNELKLFMSYEKKDKYVTIDENNKERKRFPLTVNWKMTLNFKINYFLTASIYTETVYDESFSRKLQFKENLSLGVKFRF